LYVGLDWLWASLMMSPTFGTEPEVEDVRAKPNSLAAVLANASPDKDEEVSRSPCVIVYR
jgi:hypothetical protein